MIALGPGAFRVAPIGSAERIDAAAWNALARRGFHQHRWFETAERAGWRGRHVGVWALDRLCAVAPAYLMDGGEPNDLQDRWLGPLRRVAPRLGVRLRPTLAITAPFAATSGLVGDLDVLPVAVIERLLDALETEARRAGARAVVWPYLEPGHDRLAITAARRGYLRVYDGASAHVRVGWDSLETYVASRGIGVRRTVSRELRSLTDAGLRVTTETDFRDAAPAMDALYRAAHTQRYGVAPRVAGDYFRRLAERPTPGIVAQLTWRDEWLVGMSVNLIAGDVMDGTLSAFSPEYGGGPVEINDLLYEPVKAACRDRLATVELGPTSLHSKVLRGARLRRRTTLVLGLGPRVHRLLSGLGRLVAARNARKERLALEGLREPPVYEVDP